MEFNNQLSRTQGVLKPTTTYLYVRSLIDAPPSHPDTILTTLTYMQRSLVDMGMKYIHLSIDMQLFAVTKHVLARGNFSDTSSLKLVETKGSIGHVSANAVQECGGPSWWYACYTTLRWLHCKADDVHEEFRARSVRGCSIRRTDWYIITISIFNWKS